MKRSCNAFLEKILTRINITTHTAITKKWKIKVLPKNLAAYKISSHPYLKFHYET